MDNASRILLALVLCAVCVEVAWAHPSYGGGYGGGQPVAENKTEMSEEETNYVLIPDNSGTYNPKKREVARCLGYNSCYNKELKCPASCPKRHKTNDKNKACFINCSPKCEATCKTRKAQCTGYGSICYDPRFVGGDGVMFYFHGKADTDFALVTDYDLHVNAHFIGTRPTGRSRDFTWVQALAILFLANGEQQTLHVVAKRVSEWDDEEDQLTLSYNGNDVALPAAEPGAKWDSLDGEVSVERLAETNSIQLSIRGLASISITVVPVTPEDDRLHGYNIPAGDAFAHFNLQFVFNRLSPMVEGVLGQTYRPDFKNPVKRGVAMPIMGGEDKYLVSSIFSTDSKLSLFNANPNPNPSDANTQHVLEMPKSRCFSARVAGGIVCRR